MKKVRVRIAPSPTGEPHIGNMRSFLFNWLFARQSKGKFIVRIEDTDRQRYKEGSTVAILEGLKWLGLFWDEGPEIGGPFSPYIQSERKEIYQKYADELVEKGQGYYCFCSPERLEQMRKDQEKKGLFVGYDKKCRGLNSKEVEERIKFGLKPVIRLKVPEKGETSWEDIVHGKISFENKNIDDQVLLKSDGFPTYHLAVTVDDHLMEITHILRGDGWIPSTPKQILLYQAFGWNKPLFGHLPLVVGPDKSKLSKRHGSTSVLDFKSEGYLPEAVFNFLALLGWAFDDKTEIMTRKELIERFDLKGINPTNPIFDRTKLDWMNGYYIRQLSVDELKKKLRNFDSKLNEIDDEYLDKIIPLVQERIKKLSDFKDLAGFFFEKKVSYDKKVLLGKNSEEKIKIALSSLKDHLYDMKWPWTHEAWEAKIRERADVLGFKHGDLFMLLRIAICGKKISPPLFESMIVLGREKSLDRIEEAIAII